MEIASRRWFLGSADDPVTALMRVHRQVHPRASIAPVRHGYTVAERMHKGQVRKSGEEYITHPLAVAGILAELGMDTTTLVAALLHDTVEDTSYDLPTLAGDFGDEVALLVDGVTKLDKAYFGADAEIETLRKMLVKAGEDVRVLVIKLADRLHNMRTLDARSPASRTRIATATLDTLVPLADRLGIQQLKRSLEDAVLRNLEPDAYFEIMCHVANRPTWTRSLDSTIFKVRAHLAKHRINAQVTARDRHAYSIWKDTLAKGEPVAHDLPRILVVVDGPRTDCYTALGALHTLMRPVPGRFKDFIASPKNNLYRSLHTTVVGPDGTRVEVLIRTKSMHHFAEYGIVANFRDPLTAAQLDPQDREEQLAWLHRVVSWQDVADDATRFIDALRCEVSASKIQVFSGGRGLLLPVGSTPVDVAFTIDPMLALALTGASVNGRPVRLSTALNEGDVVEIFTTDEAYAAVRRGPAREWLEFVRSPRARLEISRWYASPETTTFHEAVPAPEGKPERPASIRARLRTGWHAIGLALQAHGRALPHAAVLSAVAQQWDYPDFDAVAVAVADRKLTAADVAAHLIDYVDQPASERLSSMISPAGRRSG